MREGSDPLTFEPSGTANPFIPELTAHAQHTPGRAVGSKPVGELQHVELPLSKRRKHDIDVGGGRLGEIDAVRSKEPLLVGHEQRS